MKLNEFTIGQVFRTKTYQMTNENMMNFAKEYDPQYMHLDEEKASEGKFGGLIASGIQTLAISFKLWIEEGHYGEDVIAGTEFNSVKFIKPVYATDILHTTVEVLDIKENKGPTGILTVLLATYNDKEERVFEGELSALIKR